MRVLQLGKFFPPIWGGIETVTYNLAQGLARRGIDSAVLVVTNSGGDVQETLMVKGVNALVAVHRCQTIATLASTPLSVSFIWRFRQLMSSYDVALIHMPNPLACLAIFLSGFKGKVVLYWHSDVIRQRWLRHLYTWLQNWTIYRSNAVLGATSAHVYDSVCAKLFRGKEWIVGYPMSDEFMTEAVATRRPAIGISRKDHVAVLTVGRLVYYKGFAFLIKAAAQLPQRFEVLIAGDGPERAALEALIQSLDLTDRVRLLGTVSHEELLALYCTCDIFCLPSVEKAEMFGMVQLEAMAYGRPVVSTAIPASGVAYVNRHEVTGLIVPPRDAVALAKAIQRLAEDDELYCRLSVNAGKEVQSNYNLAAVVEKHLTVYG